MTAPTLSGTPADLTAASEALRRAFPDEVVTQAHVRDVELPREQGTLALITLDNGLDRRPTSFGPAGLHALDRALDGIAARIADDEVQAVAVTGKPYFFVAGADLKAMAGVSEHEQAVALGRLGHHTLRRLGSMGVPSFAYVNGVALGGGLETALHCTYRTVSSDARGIGLPETFLGIVPGWGGCYLLPRLIGVEKALQVIIDNPQKHNRTLSAAQVHELGIADAVFDAADFLVSSVRWTADVLAGDVRVERPDHTGDPMAWDAAVAAARERVDRKVSGAAPAPYRALDLVAAARTADPDDAYAAEDDALADLVMTDELHASLYAFDLVQRRAKRPAGAPDPALARPVTKVGVVGAGLMASQLAMVFAQQLRVPVVLTDLDQERVDRGVAHVHAQIDALRDKGRLGADAAARIKSGVTGSVDRSVYADADFVIEAVFEDLAVKKEVLRDLEGIVRPDAVLATNTSSLSVAAMAEGLEHPERVVGFHFFNPVAAMPLVEVARTLETDDATAATALATAKGLRKSAVVVADAPAFVVNRLLERLLCEITDAFDHGTDFEVIETALRPWGLPMSPFTLLQLIGPAVALHVAESVHEAFGDRFYVSKALEAIVEAGKPGVWSRDDRGRPYVDDATKDLIRAAITPVIVAAGGPVRLDADQLRERVEDVMADEVRRMLDEGVVAEPQDIDLCMILGAGYPMTMGGLTPYLDRSGASERAAGGRFLPPGVASVRR